MCRDSICREKVAMMRAYKQSSIYVRKWLCAQEQESKLAKRKQEPTLKRVRVRKLRVEKKFVKNPSRASLHQPFRPPAVAGSA